MSFDFRACLDILLKCVWEVTRVLLIDLVLDINHLRVCVSSLKLYIHSGIFLFNKNVINFDIFNYGTACNFTDGNSVEKGYFIYLANTVKAKGTSTNLKQETSTNFIFHKMWVHIKQFLARRRPKGSLGCKLMSFNIKWHVKATTDASNQSDVTLEIEVWASEALKELFGELDVGLFSFEFVYILDVNGLEYTIIIGYYKYYSKYR